jgi:uncharacterized protein (TIGR02646 family)
LIYPFSLLLAGSKMIFVARDSVRAPAVLTGPEVRKALSGARYFYSRPLGSRRQVRHAFLNRVWRDKTVRYSLFKLFHAKCAYCETLIDETKRTDIELFRPKLGAVGLDKEYSEDHYWWLAYRWENMLLACPACTRSKATKFPVLNLRATPEEVGSALSNEGALLLDPTNPDDNPVHHFKFLINGRVEPRTDRGEVTISVLSLNRSSLIGARRKACEEVKDLLDVISNSPGSNNAAWRRLEACLSPDREYLAPLRQAVVDQQRTSGIKIHTAVLPLLGQSHLLTDIGTERRTASGRVKKALDDDVLSTPYIERISIWNFRGIDRLDLTVIKPDPHEADTTPDDPHVTAGAPWFMLIGENGRGKSSILQAIAMALSKRREFASLRLDERQFLKNGKDRGNVTVRLTGHSQPISLVLGTRSIRFDQKKADGMAFAAYGATRLLPRGKTPILLVRTPTANLFNPFIPLTDADRWLTSLSPDRFDYAIRALKDLLTIDRRQVRFDVRPTRKGKRVMITLDNQQLSLDQLSDGYKSVIALTVDIIRRLSPHFQGSVEAAQGIVLLDEVGAQLHPRWKMRIVRSLRQCFPRLQFIATTHDPLCLRGLRDGEVAVLRRNQRGQIFSEADLPPIEGLRVDQLLTSEYFGLSSTLDPQIEAEFEEFYELKAKRGPSVKDRRRIGELEQKLTAIDIPGATRRERMLLEAIDSFIAKERLEGIPQRRTELKRRAKSRIAKALTKKLS